MLLDDRAMASRRDSSRTFFARRLNGRWPRPTRPGGVECARTERGLHRRADGVEVDAESRECLGVEVAAADVADDGRRDAVVGQAVPREDGGGRGVRRPQQCEQQVLGADLAVVQPGRLLLGADDDLPCVRGEPFEHLNPSAGAARGRSRTSCAPLAGSRPGAGRSAPRSSPARARSAPAGPRAARRGPAASEPRSSPTSGSLLLAAEATCAVSAMPVNLSCIAGVVNSL